MEQIVYADESLIVVQIAGQFYYQKDEFSPFIFMPGDQKKEIIHPTTPEIPARRGA